MRGMAKDKTIFTCTECGGTAPKWLGKCPSCAAWNTLIESVAESAAPAKNRYTSQFQSLAKTAEVAVLADIEATDVQRTPTGQDELDRENLLDKAIGLDDAHGVLEAVES